MTRKAGIALAAMASAAAILLAHRLGASSVMLVSYAGASIAGLLLGLLSWPLWTQRAALFPMAIALALLSTPMLGVTTGGATRWIAIGPLTLQPALFLLPVLLSAPADRWWAAGACVSAIALTLQPDVGTLGGLAFALTARALANRNIITLAPLTVTLGALALALTDRASLEPVFLIEQVWQSAIGAGLIPSLLASLAAIFGAAALWRGNARSAALLAFWVGLSLASLLGAYPTPLLGMSVSAALGFWLSVSLANPASEVHPQR